MGGPIVRTGTTPEFWKNWDQAFASKKTKAAKVKKKTSVTKKKRAKAKVKE